MLRNFGISGRGKLMLICFQVKKFLVYFRNMITEGVTYEILNLYENTFPKLTEQYFENTPWPDENEVAPIVDNDHVNVIILFCVQYYNLLFMFLN